MREWISVKDNLPEKGKAVLLFMKSGFMGIGYLNESQTSEIHKFTLYHDDFEWEKDLLTHWMPLPEPPKP